MAQTPPETVISHWSTLVEHFQASPLSFYDAVEAALARRQIPKTENSRVDYKEAGVLSAEREYLHVRLEKVAFDICGAPFGTGFFFSWWFAEENVAIPPVLRFMATLGIFGFGGWLMYSQGVLPGALIFVIVVGVGLAVAKQMDEEGNFNDNIVRALPVLGTLYVWLFRPGTYYRIDSMEMFQKAVHNAVLEVIDQITTEKGLRALSESDRKPVMGRFYERQSR